MMLPSITRRPWFIVTASLSAIAIGVAAYFVAAPFAPVAHRAPGIVEAWTLSPHDGLTPLDETTEADSTDSATAPPTGAVATSDGGPEATIGIAVDERLAAFDALILTGDADVSMTSVTYSELGLGITDPCAALVASGTDCPAGARATVLDADWESPLQLNADYGSTCAPVPTGTSAKVFTVFTNRPADVRITYPVNGETRRFTTSTTAAERDAWLTSDPGTRVPHCIVLADVPANWWERVLIEATDELGNNAQIEREMTNIVRGAVPPSWVEPLSPSAIMISIPAKDVSSVRFVAYAVPFGQNAAGCDFDDESDRRILPVYTKLEYFSQPELEARGFDRNYIERHSAAFVVPEGSTISVCAGWVDEHSWATNVPDHVFSEVLNSPDYAMPVITIDSVVMNPSATARDVKVTAYAGVLHKECGSWLGGDAYDYRPLCDYSTFADRGIPWERSLIIQAKATGFGSSGSRQYILPVMPRLCGVGCVLPSAEYYDIPLESHSNLCLGNGCGESHVGTVRLKVEWIEGNDSWADEWTRNGAAPPSADAPVMDRNATVELGAVSADGLTQSASVTITSDREGSMKLIVGRAGSSFGIEQEIVDADFVSSRTVQLDALPAGQDYALTVELTDRDGTTNIYTSQQPYDAPFTVDWETVRPWVGGTFSTVPIDLDLDVTLTLSTPDSRAIVYGNYAITIGSHVWSTNGAGYARWACTNDAAVLDLGTPTIEGTVGQINEVAISLELGYLGSPSDAPTDCTSPRATGAVDLRPTSPTRSSAEISLGQLQAGATITMEVNGLTVVIHAEPSAG